MGNYSWSRGERKPLDQERMFFNNKGLDNTFYLSVFGDAINKMNESGFAVSSFEFIQGIPNLRIDYTGRPRTKPSDCLREIVPLIEKDSSRQSWLDLTDSLNSINAFIGRFEVRRESLETYSRNIFLDLTPRFIDAMEKRNEDFLMAIVSVTKHNTVYRDFWFDYTK